MSPGFLRKRADGLEVVFVFRIQVYAISGLCVFVMDIWSVSLLCYLPFDLLPVIASPSNASLSLIDAFVRIVFLRFQLNECNILIGTTCLKQLKPVRQENKYQRKYVLQTPGSCSVLVRLRPLGPLGKDTLNNSDILVPKRILLIPFQMPRPGWCI
jgi:hypothetical protein